MAKKRYNYYNDFSYPPSRPIDVDGGIKARGPGNAATHAWWSRQWIERMENLMESARLRRGRSYARRGQVLTLEEKAGGIFARVQGSRPAPYRVTFSLSPLSAAQWERVIDALAEQALFAAQLLAGEMPAQIEQVFAAAGLSLFPGDEDDLTTDCTCPDYAKDCKHIAAVHYILADRFDEDPFLLFRMRGRSQEQILKALRERRSGQLPPEEDKPLELEAVTPLEDSLDHFWDFSQPLEPFNLSIKPPQSPAPLLKRLGDPAFLPELSLQSLLRPAYEAISRAAVELAFSEDDQDNLE